MDLYCKVKNCYQLGYVLFTICSIIKKILQWYVFHIFVQILKKPTEKSMMKNKVEKKVEILRINKC